MNILRETDIVTVLTYDENKVLNDTKLTSKMPSEWKIFQDSNFKRYEFAGLKKPTKKIVVHGALAR